MTTEMKKERKRGERKWDRQQLLTPSSPPPVVLLLSPAAEGKRRRSPTPTSTPSTCRRPCSSWIRCPLPLRVCLPALLPSLCSRCQVTAPRAQRCRSTRCPSSLPTPGPGVSAEESLTGIVTKHAQVNSYVGIFSISVCNAHKDSVQRRVAKIWEFSNFPWE